MNIACLAILDNGNTMRHVARGLRDYCNAHATAFHQYSDTYLHIPDKTVEQWAEINLDDFDFIITNDHTYYAYHRGLRTKPRLVKCNGTWARAHAQWIMWDWVKYGTTYVSSPCDYRLASVLPFSIQTLPPLIDLRLFPAPNQGDGKLVVGHAPTGAPKGTKEILAALHPYKEEIEIRVITNTPWQDAIQRKAECHIFIDQLTGAFGVNAIESLALGSIVLTAPPHPYVQQHYPDLPLHYFPTELDQLLSPEGIAAYWEHGILRHGSQNYRHDYTRTHFDLSVQAPKWYAWVESVLQGVTDVTSS